MNQVWRPSTFTAMAIVLFASSFVAGLGVDAVAGQSRAHDPARGCTYYWDADFRGESATVADGGDVPWIGDRWNDRISSVRCAPQCALTAFEHIDHGGATTSFSGENRFVGPHWNDRISSLRVTCRGRDWAGDHRPEGRRSCTYFEHANFQGRRGDIFEGRDIPSIGGQWNDSISALSCRPGCSVDVYEHIDYRGASRHFSGEMPFVGPLWNDRISSMRVSCGRG